MTWFAMDRSAPLAAAAPRSAAAASTWPPATASWSAVPPQVGCGSLRAPCASATSAHSARPRRHASSSAVSPDSSRAASVSICRDASRLATSSRRPSATARFRRSATGFAVVGCAEVCCGPPSSRRIAARASFQRRASCTVSAARSSVLLSRLTRLQQRSSTGKAFRADAWLHHAGVAWPGRSSTTSARAKDRTLGSGGKPCCGDDSDARSARGSHHVTATVSSWGPFRGRCGARRNQRRRAAVVTLWPGTFQR
mmetsp:Transcript_3133/g.10758  ORF Transcript_3133/g.10758 Transcript_3133/m.10758 type:complete len:254 (-) Transcript_3133:123-884(-)